MDALLAYLHRDAAMNPRSSHDNRRRHMKVGSSWFGHCGKTLAEGFIKHGHQTMMGTRDSAKLADGR